MSTYLKCDSCGNELRRHNVSKVSDSLMQCLWCKSILEVSSDTIKSYFPTRHNHITRDIKPLGSCPACDEYHNTHTKGKRMSRPIYTAIVVFEKLPHPEVFSLQPIMTKEFDSEEDADTWVQNIIPYGTPQNYKYVWNILFGVELSSGSVDTTSGVPIDVKRIK